MAKSRQLANTSSLGASITSVSNYDYEDAINEGKRRIKLIKPQFINEFVNNFTGLLNNG